MSKATDYYTTLFEIELSEVANADPRWQDLPTQPARRIISDHRRLTINLFGGLDYYSGPASEQAALFKVGR